MSVQEIKASLVTLSPDERSEVTAFLFQLRRSSDTEYQSRLNAIMSDKNPEHWLTPEEFEKRLDK